MEENLMKKQKVVNQNIEDIFELSPLQEGMLFHSIVDSASSAYIIRSSFDIKMLLDIQHIENALKLLMLRHSVLRTNFFYEKVEKPRQIVLKERKTDLKVIDYSDLDENTFNTEYNKLLNDEVKHNFDLRKDALLRVTYVKRNNSSKLIFTMHHIIMDGWCNTIIYSDFFKLYHKLECGEDYKKLELQINQENAQKSSYSDYIKWLNKQDNSKAYEYWKAELENYENNAEIKPMEKPEATEEQMRELWGGIDEETTEKLKKLAERMKRQ